MHVTFALFADAANISQEGKLNVLGVFDALHVASLPALHPRAALVVHLKGLLDDVGDHAVQLEWLSPSGTALWSSTGSLNMSSPPSGVFEMDVPLIAQIDLPLDLAGSYVMRVSLDGEVKSDVHLQVRAATEAPPPPTPVWMS